jgi:hypothetical protein
VDVEIDPEPSAEERAAIEIAVAALLDHRSQATPWWRAGVQEATEEADD